jgi:HEAT repeat protein
MGRVDELIRQLETGNTDERRKAATELGKLGDLNAIPALLNAYETHKGFLNVPIIEAVGEILGRTSPKNNKNRERFSRTVDWLIQIIEGNTADEWERACAAEALGKSRDPKAVPALVELLSSGKTYHERVRAARALGQLGDPKAVPALLKSLHNYNEDIDVRTAAARSIGKIGDLEVVPNLCERLHIYTKYSIEDEEAAAIVGAIGEILGRTSPDDDRSREIYSHAVDKLIHALKAAWGDKTRVAAAEALVKTRDPRTVDTLIAIMENNHESRYNRATGFVRAEVARVLSSIGDPKAIEPIIRTLEDASSWLGSDREHRKTVVDALGAFQDPRVTDALVGALSRDYHTAAAAAETLKKLRDRRAVEPLLRILYSDGGREHTREFAAEILTVLNEPRAIPALIKALHDDNGETRPKLLKLLQFFILTHPDAILRLPPEDRNLLGRLIQDARNDELLRKLCRKPRRKTRR